MPWQDGQFITTDSDSTGSSQSEGEYVSVSEQEQKAHNDNPDQPVGKDSIHDLVERDRAEPGQPRDINFDEVIYKRIRKSPEAISLAYAIGRDIVGLDYHMEYLGRSSGVQNKQKATTFWEQEGKEPLLHGFVDALFTGELYAWMNKISQDNASDKVRSIIEDNYDFNYDRSVDIAERVAMNSIDSDDEDIFSVRDIRHVPSSTIEHDINKYGDVQSFIQERSGEDDIPLDPDKMLHYQFMKLNGGTYAFPPTYAVLGELDTIANVKDFNGIRFSNAGVMNKIFKLPEDGPDSENYKLLNNTIKKYRQNRDKFKDMVLTGEVEVEELHDVQDMDFKDLIQHMVETLAMLWQVPPERAQMQMGDGQGARRSSFGNEGYYNNIYFHGNRIAAVLNKELFEPEFNCRIHFHNPNIRQEIRKADRDLRRAEHGRMMAAMGMWDQDTLAENLGIGEDERPDIDLSEEEFMMAVNNLNSAEGKFLSQVEADEDNADALDRQDKMEAGQQSPETNDDGME